MELKDKQRELDSVGAKMIILLMSMCFCAGASASNTRWVVGIVLSVIALWYLDTALQRLTKQRDALIRRLEK